MQKHLRRTNKVKTASVCLTDQHLKNLGVNVLGEALTVLKQGKTNNEIAAILTIPRLQVSITSAKPPKLSLDMSQQQFKID